MDDRQKRFGEWLVELRLISAKQLEQALAVQKTDGSYIGDILVRQTLITPEIRNSVLALQKVLNSPSGFTPSSLVHLI